jgi:hypothetical protein
MALTLANVLQPAKVNGNPAVNGQTVNWWECVETGAGGQVTILSNGTAAAVVAGPDSNTTVNLPPTDQYYMWYYYCSYRWQLKAPAGAIGIRA